MGDSSRQNQRRNQKVAVFHQVLCRLRELNVEETAEPNFEDELWAHVSMLPLRYALDVDTEQVEDVLIHKKLLNMARDPLAKPAVFVRLLQEYCPTLGNSAQPNRPLHEIFIATKDKPKILSTVTGLMMSEIGLIIQEAHAFCTLDGYQFLAFVVEGWEKGIDLLRSTLVKEIPNILATNENTNA